jgi:dienelactone hydrolase
MGHSVVMVKEALGPHAEHLVRAGFVVLAVDWRTVGSGDGEPRCQWLPSWQVEDLRAGVSYLCTRPEVDPERIGLWGHSTAAGVAVVAGALDRRVKCVAGQNPSLLDAWTALEKTRGRRQLGLGRSMGLAADFFDEHLRRAALFQPSPTPEEARARGLRPEYRTAAIAREAS